jgi:hypothetical protein
MTKNEFEEVYIIFTWTVASRSSNESTVVLIIFTTQAKAE